MCCVFHLFQITFTQTAKKDSVIPRAVGDLWLCYRSSKASSWCRFNTKNQSIRYIWKVTSTIVILFLNILGCFVFFATFKSKAQVGRTDMVNIKMGKGSIFLKYMVTYGIIREGTVGVINHKLWVCFREAFARRSWINYLSISTLDIAREGFRI